LADPVLRVILPPRAQVLHKKAARRRPANRNGEKTAMFAGGREIEASDNTSGEWESERVRDEAQ
jgi:hypothetical protein